MSGPTVYGIDFGTTNSSIAALVDDRVEVVRAEPEGEPPEAFRSVVFLHRDGDRAAGFQAARRYLMTATRRTQCRRCDRVDWLPDGPLSNCLQFNMGNRDGCNDARLVSGLKAELMEPRFETSSWAELFKAGDLVGIILWRLKEFADDHFGAEVDRALIGHPVHFLTSREGNLALGRLRDAALAAGFKDVGFYPEPVAAASTDPAEDAGKTVCSVDFGGGTFDVAVLRFDDVGDSDLLGLAGVPIGGELFDSLLFDHLIAPQLGVDTPFQFKDGRSRPLPAYIRKGLRSLNGIAGLAPDPRVFMTFKEYMQEAENPTEIAPMQDLVYGGQAFDFWNAIENGKKSLSEDDIARVTFRRGQVDVDIEIHRAQFEELIADPLEEVRLCIQEALREASVSADEIDTVVRTGGSALLPSFNLMLDEMFGAARVEGRPAFSSVAAGLAEIAVTEDWEE